MTTEIDRVEVTLTVYPPTDEERDQLPLGVAIYLAGIEARHDELLERVAELETEKYAHGSVDFVALSTYAEALATIHGLEETVRALRDEAAGLRKRETELLGLSISHERSLQRHSAHIDAQAQTIRELEARVRVRDSVIAHAAQILAE